MSKNGVWMILGGGLLTVAGLNEARQSAVARREPQEITCAKLTQEGFGNNAHVRMTDFYLCEDEYVYEERIQWTSAWVPAVPRGSPIHQALLTRGEGRNVAPALRGQDIRIIVLLPNARSEKDVEETAKCKAIQGLIIRPLRLLDTKKQRLLEESYPGLDFQDCMILVEGRQPATQRKTFFVTGAGIGLMAVGGLFLLQSWRKQRKSEWITVDEP
jgi:hypothetical protein